MNVDQTSREALARSVEEARQSAEYRNYLEVREAVLEMIDETRDGQGAPSAYWQEELAGFDYMLDASPLVIRHLRHHCYHLTGEREYDYRRHHAHATAPAIEAKLRALQREDSEGVLVPESPLLGGFGVKVDGALYNVGTLKFYECLIALSRGGLLADLRNGAPGRVVIEIGAGWGGFAYQFKTLCPNVTYVIVDLPAVLLFSATYLKTAFPQARCLILRAGDSAPAAGDLTSFDFVFAPNTYWERLRLNAPYLCVNIASFQEMTSAQVGGYVRGLAEMRCSHLYSLNRDRSPHNDELTAVSAIVEQYYDVAEIRVLDVPYTRLVPGSRPAMNRRAEIGESWVNPAREPEPVGFSRLRSFSREIHSPVHSLARWLRNLSRGIRSSARGRDDRSPFDHRHLIGSLRQERRGAG